MVDVDIVEPVDEPTDLVYGLAIVEKPNGKLRIYLEPQPLSQAIKREHLHLPTAEELFSNVGSKILFEMPNEYPMVYILPVKFLRRLFCQ